MFATPSLIVTMVTLLLGSMAVPAGAITNGTPDAEHTNVGALVVDLAVAGSVARTPFCTGSLLTATHFLTAGHCTDDLDGLSARGILQAAWVTFDQDLRLNPLTRTVDPEHLFRVSTWEQHPGLRCTFAFCQNDLSVLTLVAPISGIDPIMLPPEGLLDDEAARGALVGHVFVHTGYGIDVLDRSIESPNATVVVDGTRDMAPSPFLGLTRNGLWLLQSVAATGGGGVCLGDSGSPVFFEPSPGSGANLAVALATMTDPACQAQNGNVRLDTPSARSFLGRFVTLP